jgi:hypothetical protein
MKNWMVYSVFFLILGLLARARGIILHLSTPKSAVSEDTLKR